MELSHINEDNDYFSAYRKYEIGKYIINDSQFYYEAVLFELRERNRNIWS